MSIAKKTNTVISTETNIATANANARLKIQNAVTRYGMKKKRNVKTILNVMWVGNAKNASA